MKTIMNKFTLGLATMMAVLSLTAVPAYAADADTVACADDNTISLAEGVKCAKSADQKGNLGNIIQAVTNVLLFIIGAVSVIMIILGGLKYVLSNGDSSQITSAKNTILYAVIGLIVALLAFAIVNFVLDSFTGGTTTDASQTKTN
jgi:hypothetical protein